ncbi:MAG: hypothetical protein HY017_20580 [Betaproteobacteria bacterium]|nr:hypothetical protein [Betaproteobacteria bacterium]
MRAVEKYAQNVRGIRERCERDLCRHGVLDEQRWTCGDKSRRQFHETQSATILNGRRSQELARAVDEKQAAVEKLHGLVGTRRGPDLNLLVKGSLAAAQKKRLLRIHVPAVSKAFLRVAGNELPHARVPGCGVAFGVVRTSGDVPTPDDLFQKSAALESLAVRTREVSARNGPVAMVLKRFQGP